MSGASRKAGASPVATDAQAFAELQRETARALATVSDQALEIAKLRDQVGGLQAEIAAISQVAQVAMEAVEQIRREVQEGAVSPTGTALTAARYRELRRSGVTDFVVLEECRHPALRVRAGSNARAGRYDQTLVEEMISSGHLKLGLPKA